jgi:hypothetical protein
MNRLLKLTSALCGFVIAFEGHAAADEAPPSLDLVMTPHAANDGGYIDVSMTIEAPKLAAGEGLVRLPLTLVGIPSARYDGDALTASDAKGDLPLTQEEEPPTPQGVYRRWVVTRATEGDVTVTYKAPPREVTAATNNGPLFDLRAEAGGFAGAGVGFIATPVKEGPYSVSLKWDMSDAPEGSFGAWSLGEGDVERVAPASALSFSYYAAGPLKRYPPRGEDSKFGLYWLAEPPFDPAALAGRIEKLYEAMSSFFDEDQSAYRVFIRQNPYKGRGGSALAGSFMFGYNKEDAPTIDDLQSLLAHEMAHNWPAMQGEHGLTAWYSEGTAEFYSLMLAYRAGLITTDKYLEEINQRASGYYSNPYRALSNEEAAQKFWTDPIAQTVPYGRGFMYLVQTDAAIRAKTKGKRSLDDIVLEMRRRQNSGEAFGIPEWLDLVGEEIGDREAKKQFEGMTSGELLVADDHRFAPCFEVVPEPARPFVLGFARSSLNDDRIVRGLEPGSEAARLGVREGDKIVDVKGMEEARRDNAAEITLTISRPDGDVEVTYLPRGAEVEGYAWARADKASGKACKF